MESRRTRYRDNLPRRKKKNPRTGGARPFDKRPVRPRQNRRDAPAERPLMPTAHDQQHEACTWTPAKDPIHHDKAKTRS